MALKELQPNLLNDYEHRIRRTMEKHEGEAGFPTLDGHHITQQQLEDYLFDYQATLDSEGSARAQQTLYGIITVAPVIVLSALPTESLPFHDKSLSLLTGVGIGLAIALAIKAIRVSLKRYKLSKLRSEQPDVARFCDEVDKLA